MSRKLPLEVKRNRAKYRREELLEDIEDWQDTYLGHFLIDYKDVRPEGVLYAGKPKSACGEGTPVSELYRAYLAFMKVSVGYQWAVRCKRPWVKKYLMGKTTFLKILRESHSMHTYRYGGKWYLPLKYTGPEL